MLITQTARFKAVLPAMTLIVVPLLTGWSIRAVAAQQGDSRGAAASPTAGLAPDPGYADLVNLVEQAPLVFNAQIHKDIALEPERAHGVRSGWARIYVEAKPLTALRGTLPAVPLLTYLADVPLNSKGKLPSLAKRTVLLLARPVPDQPEMVQLVAPEAQLSDDPASETRVRGVIAALTAPDAPAVITGVREAMYEPGTLAGEGETQIFLVTASGDPASISVEHQPGHKPSWSVSFSEVVNASGLPPAHDTLAWYRLACALPAALPEGVNVSETPDDRAQAVEDYQLVLKGLGACGRTSGL